jgi:hypothetical protein
MRGTTRDWTSIDPHLRQWVAEGLTPHAMCDRLGWAKTTRQSVVDRLRKLGLQTADARRKRTADTPMPDAPVDVLPGPMTINDADTPAVLPIGTITPVPSEPLSTDEVQTLQHYEAIIARGLKTFVEVGQALLTIREHELYRESYATFEDYCRHRWDLGQSRAYQLMDAADVVTTLKSSTIVEVPANEAQARPLASLPPEQRVEVWQEAVKTAPPTGITAKHVKGIADRINRTRHAARRSNELNGHHPGTDTGAQATQWRERLTRQFHETEEMIRKFAKAGGVLILARDWDPADQRRFVLELRSQARTMTDMANHFERVIAGEEAALAALADGDPLAHVTHQQATKGDTHC